jgi:hypothetical protein
MKDHFDERLAALLQDVLVPEGLAQRVLKRLDDENSGLKHEKRSLARASWTVPSRLMVGSGLLATAAMLLIVFWLNSRSTGPISEQFVLNEAIRLFETIEDQPGSRWTEKAASINYPFSKAILPVRGMRWRPVNGWLSGRGVMYDLPGPVGANAVLYVMNVDSMEDLQEKPAQNPFSTAGCCASAWLEEGLLYILVVKGDAATYRTYLDIPHQPVAALRADRQSSPKPV